MIMQIRMRREMFVNSTKRIPQWIVMMKRILLTSVPAKLRGSTKQKSPTLAKVS
jgi:hypothetical protein